MIFRLARRHSTINVGPAVGRDKGMVRLFFPFCV